MFWWQGSEGLVLHALLYGTQRVKDAVRDSTKWVGLSWSASERAKAVEVLVYNSYLEKVLTWSIPKPHPGFILEGASWNRLKRSHGVSKKQSSVHSQQTISYPVSQFYSLVKKRKASHSPPPLPNPQSPTPFFFPWKCAMGSLLSFKSSQDRKSVSMSNVACRSDPFQPGKRSKETQVKPTLCTM